MTEMVKTTYGGLRNGDVVVLCGYRFEVAAVRIASRAGDKTTLHSEPNRADVIRFMGRALDDSLIGTGYDCGTYGAYADEPIVVRRKIAATPSGWSSIESDSADRADAYYSARLGY